MILSLKQEYSMIQKCRADNKIEWSNSNKNSSNRGWVKLVMKKKEMLIN